jgi:hypothetical protein
MHNDGRARCEVANKVQHKLLRCEQLAGDAVWKQRNDDMVKAADSGCSGSTVEGSCGGYNGRRKLWWELQENNAVHAVETRSSRRSRGKLQKKRW